MKNILHIDGDSFFAGCEVAKNPNLKGKAVVVGQERGIALALTYEAKARGVKRGMTMHEVRRVCPEAIILPSDYRTYSLYSKRMFSIVKRYSDYVEEYSIDECFATLDGFTDPNEIAKKIKEELNSELNMTFSLGIAQNKVLAKIASNWKKPNGLTIIETEKIKDFLKEIPVNKIWGIGYKTTKVLKLYGINTALDFVAQNENWIKSKFAKPYYQIWQELNGQQIFALNEGIKDSYSSISKTRTFTPASKEYEYLFSQLSKNIERACAKARRYDLKTNDIAFYLKTTSFTYLSDSFKLLSRTNLPCEIISLVKPRFNKIFNSRIEYRATGVFLNNLAKNSLVQLDLFGKEIQQEKTAKIYKKLDLLNEKYGKNFVFVASSLDSKNNRKVNYRKVINKKLINRLKIPFLGEIS